MSEWTNEKPLDDGEYWVRHDAHCNTARIVYLCHYQDCSIGFYDGGSVRIDDAGWWFAGPVVAPPFTRPEMERSA